MSAPSPTHELPEQGLRAGYDRLLGLLHEDPLRAAEELERLRGRLVRMFSWRGARYPEDFVDDVLERVAEQLARGTEIRAADPFRYVCGVAFLVFKETARKEQKERKAHHELYQLPLPYPTDRKKEAQLACLDSCLAQLDGGKKRLVLDYYQGDKGEKISNRRALASRLGIKPVALRLRALRIREKLEGCVSKCLGASNEGNTEHG